jgi:N-acetylmuramoyl-L-alanine amidase
MSTYFTTSVNLTDRCYKGRGGRVPTLIGIHTMQAPEAGSTAENVANYFKTVDASAHWCVDNNSRVRCVDDANGAWTMPPTNLYSLNVEMAGYAEQTSVQWADAYSVAVLDITAVCVAEWCRKFNIPARHLTAGGIDAGEKGIAGHWDVNNVFHESTHWDPGLNFPWAGFLARVNGILGSAPPVSKPNCTALQRAVRTTADNLWGQDTDKHGTAVIDATIFAGENFPYGVPFAQLCVGTVQDGVWGSNSRTALKATVKNVQTALAGMGFTVGPDGADGIWGPNTDRAYQLARTACHI